VPSAGAAAGASAAGGAASAGGAAGVLSVVAGGAAAVSGLAASCFAQAVSISAATSALRASLVFIDRYPKEKQEWYENDTNEFGRSASPIRIAAANSIESPVDLKQWERVVGRSRHRACSCVLSIQRTATEVGSGRRPFRQEESPAVIWQACPPCKPLRARSARTRGGRPFGRTCSEPHVKPCGEPFRKPASACFHWSR
jgi:hypothetical protein